MFTRGRFVSAILAIFPLATLLSAQSSNSPVNAEAREKAIEFGRKAFTHCNATDNPEIGDSYLIGPSAHMSTCMNLFGQGGLFTASPKKVTSCEGVFAFHPTEPNPYPEPRNLTSADVANGFEWKGIIKMNYDRTRSRSKVNGVWQDWDDWQDNSSGAPIAVLAKRNGRWYAADLRMTGKMLSDDSVPTNLNDIFNLVPAQAGVEGAQLLTQGTVSFTQLLVDIEQPTCDRIFSNTPVVPKAPLKELKTHEFFGTNEGFITAFPAILRQATDALGVSDKDYEKERAYILDTVRACSQMTQDQILSARIVNRDGSFGNPILSKMGEQYKNCNSGSMLSTELHSLNKERALGIQFSSQLMWNAREPDQTGFRISVDFYDLKTGTTCSSVENCEGNLIVSARTYQSSAYFQQHIFATPLTSMADRNFSGTAQQFLSALPGIIQRAATAMSLDPKSFEKEAALIAADVQTCARITPAMIKSTRTWYPKMNAYGNADINKLSSEFDVCKSVRELRDISAQAKPYNKDTQRGILIAINGGFFGTGWSEDGGFRIDIYFSPLTSEKIEPTYNFRVLGIASAAIH